MCVWKSCEESSLARAEDLCERVGGSRTVNLVVGHIVESQMSKEFVHNSVNSGDPFQYLFSTMAE